MKSTLIILLTFAVTRGMACDCEIFTLKENQTVSYERAQSIFIGDIIEIDIKKGNYKIEIIEVLKGEFKTKTIAGTTTTSCSGFPRLGQWIIYVDSFNGETIEFSSCGMSRSFSEPQLVMVKDYTYPIPPKRLEELKSKEATDVYLDLCQRILTIKQKALIDLELEIENLRRRK